MGHINAGIEWLLDVFNSMWPLVLATFVGAWLAFKHQRNEDKKHEHQRLGAIGKRLVFVLAGYHDLLETLQAEKLVPVKNHPRRWRKLESALLPKHTPKLEVSQLPRIFGEDDFVLMNQAINLENRFERLRHALQERQRLQRQYEQLEADKAPPEKLEDNRKRLHRLTDSIYQETGDLQDALGQLLDELRKHVHQATPKHHHEWVDYAAWGTLAFSVAIAGVFFFSHWAVNSNAMIEQGLDISLVSAIVFAVSLYASLALVFVMFVMCLYTLLKRMKSFNVYFWTMLVSAQPVVYLLWLDVG